MGGKTMVSGTTYEITSGKTMVSGTTHEITSGKTLVDGVAYEITFGPRNIEDLFKKATIFKCAGTTASSAVSVDMSDATATTTYYLFVTVDVGVSIYKYLNGTLELLSDVSINTNARTPEYAHLYQSGTTLSVSLQENPTSANTIRYGKKITVFQFDCKPNIADEFFTNLTLVDIDENSYASANVVEVSLDGASYAFVFYANYVAINKVISSGVETLLSNYTNNPSLLYISGTTARVSTSGGSMSVRGTTVFTISND